MIPTAAAIGLLLAVVSYLLSQLGFRGVRAFGALALVALLLVISASTGELFGAIGNLPLSEGVTDITRSALKIVFVGYVFGFSSDIAAELGEGGIASAVMIGARIEMMLIALPYIKDIIKLALELI